MELGNQTALLATIFFAGAALLVVMDRWYLPRASKSRAERSAIVLASLVALVGVVAAVWVIRTGHEGARITWDGVNL